MLEAIITKVRGLIEDVATVDYQAFEYKISNIFTLRNPNVLTIVKILYNGTEISASEYSLSNNQVTIVHEGAVALDKIEVYFTCYQNYSDTEITSYIKNALFWISICGYATITLGEESGEDGEVFDPELTEAESNLVAVIASILILPHYSSYRLPNLTINYPEKMSKTEKITQIINRFKDLSGVNDILEIENLED